ncbi:EamA family transporter [Galactobacter valiniphilus]|uniref:EamA family transporter n=1 Tax=Galactobacter valiniphilus TaxID=2676122 RepID=UPI00373517BC
MSAPVSEERREGARPAAPQRGAVLKAGGFVALGSSALQVSSVIAAGLFAALGPFETSGLRLLIAAVLLLIVFRPRLRGRSRADWFGIVGYGVAMAAMNACLYAAIDRIPLGIAVTLDFLGPCVVALAASRHVREALCALGAFVGVLLISLGPGGYFDPLGYAFALGGAVFFGLYTVMASRVGKADGGLGDLALSVGVAAVLTLPFSLPHLASVTAPQWGLLAVSAVLGVAFTFTMDTLAGRVADARVVGTWFALDPVLGSLAGLLFMSQALTWSAGAGIVLVAASGALLVWVAGRRTPSLSPDGAVH